MPEDVQPVIYSIGHSDHTLEAFITLLHAHKITIVADVRSQPYSRWVPAFNRETLARALQAAGITYIFLGDSLGGRPADATLYAMDAPQGRPDYERLASTPAFQNGLERLLALAHDGSVAMMCSEGDPRQCHRGLLITPQLLERGARVIHILPDGTTVVAQREPKQLSLF
jgi:uncharacterized protein (DUF488 family)